MTTTVIPIEHHSATHEIEPQASVELQSLTLADVVAAVSEVSESEEEAIATITYMIESGRLRLSPGADAESGIRAYVRDENASMPASLNLAS